MKPRALAVRVAAPTSLSRGSRPNSAILQFRNQYSIPRCACTLATSPGSFSSRGNVVRFNGIQPLGSVLLEPHADSPELLAIVRSHHERWDGDGYPDGLEADQIPLGARIVAVADAFTAMVEPRPYREPLSCRLARAELLEQAGKQFDPLCARAGFSVTGALLPAANG